MGRNKPHHVRRARPVKTKRTRPQEAPAVEEMYSGLREMAQKAVDEAVERLLASGASRSDIRALEGATRSLAVSDMWDQDIHLLVELSRTHERGPMVVFDVLADAILPDPDSL